MNPLKRLISIVSIMLIALSIGSCSNGKNPTNPADRSNDYPESQSIDLSNRDIVAVYDVEIDTDAKTVKMTPDNRSMMFHYSVPTSTLRILSYGWIPSFWADIRLTHPYPGSGRTGYDPRVIAIIPANPGVSFNYPALDVNANNKVVLYPDGYTKLFDYLGGSTPGNANPFKAYFQNEPYRQWASTGVTSETQRWYLKLTGFGGVIKYKFAVDVSTNYPHPPTPITDNAKEPVKLAASVGAGLSPEGGSALVEGTYMDWQNWQGVSVYIDAPSLFNEALSFDTSPSGPGEHEYGFSGYITNSLHAPEGIYPLLVGACDDETDVFIYMETTAEVVAGMYPELVRNILMKETDTDPWANDVKIQGDYAYVGETGKTGYGLYAIDINPPEEAYVYDFFQTTTRCVDVSGEYAYSTGSSDGMTIFSIPPEDILPIKSVPDAGSPGNIKVQGNYAYTANVWTGLKVINIEPPESAHVVGEFVDSYWSGGVDADDRYIYTTDHSGLLIFSEEGDNDPILLTNIILGGSHQPQVRVSGEFAYVAMSSWGMKIVDVIPPEEAHVVNQLVFPAPSQSQDIAVANGYAYLACREGGLQVIDIDPVEEAHVEFTIACPGEAWGVDVLGDYAYVAAGPAGLCIFKVW